MNDEARTELERIKRFHLRWMASFPTYEAGFQFLVQELRDEDQIRRALPPLKANAKAELQKIANDLDRLTARMANPAIWEWAEIEQWERGDEVLSLMQRSSEFFRGAARRIEPLTKARPGDRSVALLFLALRQVNGKAVTLSREGQVAREFAQLHAEANHPIDQQSAYDQLKAAKKAIAGRG
jgi:hypothetical protein